MCLGELEIAFSVYGFLAIRMVGFKGLEKGLILNFFFPLSIYCVCVSGRKHKVVYVFLTEKIVGEKYFLSRYLDFSYVL